MGKDGDMLPPGACVAVVGEKRSDGSIGGFNVSQI